MEFCLTKKYINSFNLREYIENNTNSISLKWKNGELVNNRE